MMDVMRIDDHAYEDKNGKVINLHNERESKLIEELISKNEFVCAFGGHKGAAGLTIKKDDYDNFVNQITKECDNIVYEEEIIEVISIEKEELTFKAYQDLLKLGPFGEGNEKPLFIINNCDTKLFNKSKDGKHLLMNISNEAGIVGFNMGSSINNEIDSYNLVVKIERNNMYQNKITCFCIEMEANNNV
jgi:single-stranded-DNA-specific exonuclease